jgi:DNA-binding NarL/FixJ family response regulator
VADRAPITVLIIDDDPYARDSMRSLLAHDQRTRVWGCVGSVDEAIAAVRGANTAPPEVILLDMVLNSDMLGGVRGVPGLRAACPGARILIASMVSDEETVLAAIRAGADGYVWKAESLDRIANAIVRVTEGRFVVTQSIAERLLGKAVELSASATEIMREQPNVYDLTEALRKTLYLYCMCGMSAREIAEELQVSVNTVNSRIQQAYQILDATNRSEAFRRLVEGPKETPRG